jgi:hypothetical protein
VILTPLGPWLLMDTVMLDENGVAVLRWVYFVGFLLSSTRFFELPEQVLKQ